nr:hypothetical protein [Candidatus Freyarchaeota archaeon]
MLKVRESLYNSIVVCSLLSAADRIGLNPMVLGRQTATVLVPLLGDIFKKTLGKKPPSNMEELVKDIQEMMKDVGLADPERNEVSFSGNQLIMKSSDCFYREMAEFGKTLGYTACPLCALSIFLMGTIKALNLGQISSVKAEYDGTKCTMKLEMLEE